MASDGSPREMLVRQYELLLVRRHRFLLVDTVASLRDAVHSLQRAESLLRGALRSRDASRPPPRTPTRKTTFHDIAEAVYARLKQLTASAPIFLGDTVLEAFARALREFTQESGVKQFWTVPMDAEEYYVARELASDVMKALERNVRALETAMEAARPTTSMLREKREHLVWLVDQVLAIVNTANTSQIGNFEERKQRLLEDYKSALLDPSIIEEKQLKHEMDAIEQTLVEMLRPHLDACLPISAANAKVEDGSGLSADDRKEIEAFVSLAERLKHHGDDLESALGDASSFIHQIQLFEVAASRDLFFVYSSALKLNFETSLDSELFLAYVTDWRDKKSVRETILVSANYVEASRRVQMLNDAILRNESELANCRHKKLGLDEDTKAALRAEISNVFDEAGADVRAIAQIIT